MDLSKGDAARIAIRISESVFMRRSSAYDRDLRSLSIFKFCFDASEMRNEKPKRPREPFRLLRGRFESNENQYDEFLSFTLHNRFKNYGVDSNCHQSTDAVAVNLPTRSKGGALARANGCELVATFTMEVQVRVSCEIFHLTAHFTANHRRA